MGRHRIDVIGVRANPLDLADSIVEASEKGNVSFDELEIVKNRIEAELERRNAEEG